MNPVQQELSLSPLEIGFAWLCKTMMVVCFFCGGVIIQWFTENLVFVGWDVADVTRPLVMRPDLTLVERKRGLVTI